ncbi:MAG: DUF262 domain-containing protein [Rhabdochlamydiaceae bacterium]
MENKSDSLEVEVEDNAGDDEVETPIKYSITSYGADYTIDGLVKRINAGDIYVPSFQRSFVWPLTECSKFIESLLLGLPVPGIFLSKEQKTQKLLIIDGLQRLKTLQSFYAGIFPQTKKEFELKKVQSQFEGKTYLTLAVEDRRRLDDSIIHATIIKQDEPSSDDSSIYHIFERLNTGGMQLVEQEIRACVYHGEFNDLLRRLNANDNWRSTFGKVSARMRDQELILRFLALFFKKDYNRPMKDFLNKFMSEQRHLGVISEKKISDVFNETILLVETHIGENAFKPRKSLSAAIFDSVMIGIARRLEKDRIHDPQGLKKIYDQLLANVEFTDAIENHTSDAEKVSKRIELATKAFDRVS